MATLGQTTRIYELDGEQCADAVFRLHELGELLSAGVIDHATCLRLELAVQEAVTNGFEHGNLGLISAWKEEVAPDGRDRFSWERQRRLDDPTFAKKKVRVTVEYSPAELVICVQDEGLGFSPTEQEPSKGVESFGRGLAMIRANVDEVTFEDSGRVIRLVKKLSTA